MNYEKITKIQARKMHTERKAVYCLPCNVRPNNMWVGMAEILPDYDFEKFCNEYAFYNCGTNYLGKRIAFYKEA